MSRKEEILKALAAKGIKVESIEWEPIRKGGIMCGHEGGWTIFIEDYYLYGICNPIAGYNYKEVLNQIDNIKLK